MSSQKFRTVQSLFISPHFDDVALSCGGTVAKAARAGGAQVVTVFAGNVNGELNEFAQFQHRRWGTAGDAVDERRQEELTALKRLGASHIWLDYPDAIYRDSLYLSDDELFGDVRPEDMGMATAVVDTLVSFGSTILPRQIYLPLAVGGHVDHRICQMAARPLLDIGADLWLYEDFPYAATPGAIEQAIQSIAVGLLPTFVDVTDDLDQRLAAIDAYASQIPTIFRNYGSPDNVVRGYAELLNGRPGRYSERFWRFG